MPLVKSIDSLISYASFNPEILIEETVTLSDVLGLSPPSSGEVSFALLQPTSIKDDSITMLFKNFLTFIIFSF